MNSLIRRLLVLTILSSIYVKGYSYERDFHLFTTPSQAVNVWRPMLTIGAEMTLIDRLGFCAEYGNKYYDFHEEAESMTDSKGYYYRLELKVYDLPFLDFENANNYFSLEYKYIHDNHDGNFQYYSGSTGEEINDIFSVHSNINIGNIKYGVLIGLGNTMYLDLFCGIGIRHRDIKNSNREYDPDAGDEFANIEPVMNSYYLEESSGFYPNVTVGFKFGIRF